MIGFLSILAISLIPYSFAWEGLMAMDADKRNVELGEKINYDGFLYGAKPLEDELIHVTVFERDSGKTILEFNLTPSDEIVDYFENTAWAFSFVVDTSQNFLPNKEFIVSANYDDKSTKLNFLTKEPSSNLKEKAKDAGEAIIGAGSETGELIVESGKEAGKVIVETGEAAIEEAKEFDENNKAQRQEIADKVEQKGSEIIQEIENTAGGGCLIATASYGSELAPQVQKLREIRDDKLLSTKSGSLFLDGFSSLYYSFSPTIADYERENQFFKEVVKLAITPMISSLLILDNAEMNTEAEVLGIGASIILLNIGMYVGVPIGLFVGVRKTIYKD